MKRAPGPGRGAGLLLAGLAALALAPGPLPAGSAAPEVGLRTCSAIAADAARLACYDALAGRPAASATAGAAAAPATAPAAAPPAAQPLPSPEALFGLDSQRSEAAVRDATGIGQIDTLEARVAALRADASGKAVLTLDNGQSWAQLDARPARLAVGELVRIRRAAFGSYLLVPPDGGRALRVRRIG